MTNSYKTIIVISCMGFIQSTAQAVDWVITPGVVVAETYLDNVTLADNNKLDDFVTEVNPTLRITRNSRGLTVLANYQMQNTLYADESDFNDTYHSFDGYVSANVIKDLFFVDLNGTYGQQNISSLGAMATNNLNVTGNRTNVSSARIKPYVDYNIKRYANLNAGVELGTVRYDRGLNDSDLTRYNFDLTSGPKFNRMNWAVNFYRNEIDYDQRPDSILQRSLLTLGYQASRKIRLLATGGYDDNSFITGPTISDGTSGSSWSVGAEWKISPLTSLEASFGERYYGKTGSFLFTKRGRRTSLSLSYLEDITVSSANQFGVNLFQTTDQFGGAIDPIDAGGNDTDPGSTPPTANSDLSDASISSEFYVRKRLQGGVQFTTAKTTLSLDAYKEDRDYQISGLTEKVTGAYGSVNWRISARTTAILSGSWINRKYRTGTDEDDIYNVRAYITHLLRKNLTGLIGYGYLERDSNIAGSDYKQNAGRISLRWTYR